MHHAYMHRATALFFSLGNSSHVVHRELGCMTWGLCEGRAKNCLTYILPELAEKVNVDLTLDITMGLHLNKKQARERIVFSFCFAWTSLDQEKRNILKIKGTFLCLLTNLQPADLIIILILI